MSRTQRSTEGEPPASPHVKSDRGSKVPCWAVALLVVCTLLAAALIVIYRLSSVIETLSDKQTPTACKPQQEGWEQHGGRCYYFNNNKSSWEESRGFCKEKGGDLVKIDSREEQSFLDTRLSEIMMHAEDKFWIGLTDSQTEAAWTWVDGSLLNQSLMFWSKGQPDNWTGENREGEDCVRMGEDRKSRDLKTWYDKSCDKPHRSVCEKSAE
ncbi:C-type lectin domain family 4 member F-like [Parambassis ranga]|uniref:C-type lectin domain family 4 member F-like n=1 Tax=Parambassis ranga TaxID=210632 RepID=A0A6P7HLQ7_9TELE|nr:C-type lectin domain family 4 member F-like [Parambassis ranga]